MQGDEGGHLFRLTCSVVLRGGRNIANKYHWCVWGVLVVTGPHWVCSRSPRVCAFLVKTAQAPGCSAGELSKAGPGLRAEPLRFRFSGTPQRCFVPFQGPSSSGAQVLGERALPRWETASYCLPRPSLTVSPSQVCCVSPLGS